VAYVINGGDYPHAHSRVIYANNHDECWWDGSNAENKFYAGAVTTGPKRRRECCLCLAFSLAGRSREPENCRC
jgi:hypothetical protein